MGVGAALVCADWLAFGSMWVAPTNKLNLMVIYCELDQYESGYGPVTDLVNMASSLLFHKTLATERLSAFQEDSASAEMLSYAIALFLSLHVACYVSGIAAPHEKFYIASPVVTCTEGYTLQKS
jgi:hypothetical protein